MRFNVHRMCTGHGNQEGTRCWSHVPYVFHGVQNVPGMIGGRFPIHVTCVNFIKRNEIVPGRQVHGHGRKKWEVEIERVIGCDLQ